MFDEMMRVLRETKTEAADDRRHDQERWNARADLFDEDQRTRWNNLHVELTPLIHNQIAAHTAKATREAAAGHAEILETLELLRLWRTTVTRGFRNHCVS